MALNARPRKLLTLAHSRGSASGARLVILIMLGIWLTVVVFTATKHEFWRDEVRALSLVREAASPLDLLEAIQGEGHPPLWYLLLYGVKSVIDTPLILPIVSVLLALIGVTLFMFRAPFPLWFRALFIFSALPLYEYSVMARNYGISMLLLVLVAMLYGKRARHPWLLAAALGLLANTNGHSAIIVGLITLVWVWDIKIAPKEPPPSGRSISPYLPISLILVALLLFVRSTIPQEETIVTAAAQGVNPSHLLKALIPSLLRPDLTFDLIISSIFPGITGLLLMLLAVVGLIHRPQLLLAALGGQVLFGLFFRLIYAGAYRHQGLYLLLLIFLYWLHAESTSPERMGRYKRLLYRSGLYLAITPLVLGNVAKVARTNWPDIVQQRSSSRALGEFLSGSELYRDAIIVPEPDFLLESLPYYASNMIYLPRERRFGSTVNFTMASNPRLSLGEILNAAGDLQTRYPQPILLVIGHLDVEFDRAGEISYSYNKIFTWSMEAVDDLNRATTMIAEFNEAYTNENYRVLHLK